MKEIKVKAIFGAHQIYQEIANYPPKNVKYLGISKETSTGSYYQNKKLKERISRIAQKIKMPRFLFIKERNFDIIHSSRGIIPIQLLSNKPWVLDLEYFSSFMGLNIDSILKNKGIRRIIENKLASKNCKKILCHCEATKESMKKYFNSSRFQQKLDILYPSSHLIPLKKEIHKKVRILCVLSLFEQKGGKLILQSFKNLEKKYKNIELWMKSDVPERIKERFKSPNIKFIKYHKEVLPREELLKELYFKSDIFVYPSFADSFGYSLIDAMVSGLPIIGTNLFAIPEIVVHKKNGFVIEIPGYNPENFIQFYNIKKLDNDQKEIFIKNLTKNIGILIENKDLREKMGRRSLKMISNGKFSIKERNKKLRNVYEEALK